MQEASTKTVAIILGIYFAILIICFLLKGKDYLLGFAIISSLIAALGLLVGLVVMIPQSTRKFGANIFISSILILLVGFGVCTSNL